MTWRSPGMVGLPLGMCPKIRSNQWPFHTNDDVGGGGTRICPLSVEHDNHFASLAALGDVPECFARLPLCGDRAKGDSGLVVV